jgi:hypothetical protein
MQGNCSHEGYSVVENNSEVLGARECEQVRAYTVDEILSDLRLHESAIDIFKIDVEGAERFIFCQEGGEWLRRVNVIIMEMPDNDAPGSFQLIIDRLSSLGIRGSSFICGENFVFCREESGFGFRQVVGLDK